jgi:methyl-accepting chemotaxis protein
MPSFDNQSIQLIFIAVTATAVLLQTIILLAIFLTVRKTARFLAEKIDDLHSSVLPVLTSAREVLAHAREVVATTQTVLTRIAPKVESATADLADVAHGLREQTAEMEASAMDIVKRLHGLAKRLDDMFSGVLNMADRASSFLSGSVTGSVRQISAVVASAKAIVESLRTSEPAVRHPRVPGDKDMFI